jgi:hypothetical protein
MVKAKNKRSNHRRTKPASHAKEAAEAGDVVMDDVSDAMQRIGGLKTEADADARSVITNKMLRDLHLKKKEKQKLKHSMWKKRVNAVVETREKSRGKGKKKRHIADIVGDMSSMLESLPIEVLLNKVSAETNSKRERKPKGVETETFRQQQKLSGISLFRSVLYHPEFKANPIQTVTEHLRNKIERENNDNV